MIYATRTNSMHFWGVPGLPNFLSPEGNAPNKSLVLTLDLDDVSTDDIGQSLEKYLKVQLASFMKQYQGELRLNAKNIEATLGRPNPFEVVLDLVRRTGNHLFVGVDNYTSPLGRITSSLEIHGTELSLYDLVFSPIDLAACNDTRFRVFVLGADVRVPIEY
ncbi:hypothetical protein BDN72DRAFT_831789 [Pluteus cervinus]|uniref:Uncharacterized protein n=1 Tax=Pluteus cervinus TaxID=181527 RepID=A0ACD3BCT7_9AGAR|nr:hypothetical protein BDN72DRAFT_831789 [Pluteus cervinus]